MIEYFMELILLSFLVSGFMLLLKPSIISIIIGGSAVAAAAVLTETYVLNNTSDLFLLLIAAPVIEEVLKLLGTSYGKSIRNAIGVGFGFAVIENAVYLSVVFSSYSITLALVYMLARGMGDPLLHASSTSISVKSWEGSKSALPKAIGLHFIYNLWAVMIVGYPFLFRFEPIVIILLLLLLLYISGNLRLMMKMGIDFMLKRREVHENELEG
ncbi:MAG: hypothetical protein QXU98_05795 [Candidatus Parvarchaeota archaeon]